jgi:tetratricopeptide (TPR) repeat protein
MLFNRFGWKGKAQRAIETALAGDFPAAEVMLAPMTAAQRASAWTSLADTLTEKGRKEEARRAAQHALAAMPDHWNALLVLAELDQVDDPRRTTATYRRLHQLDPRNELVARVLADRLFDEHALEDALDVLSTAPDSAEVELLRAKIFASDGRVEDALAPLRSLLARADRDRRSGFGVAIPQDVLSEAETLHDGLIAKLHGAEQVVVEHAARGSLAVRSGHNHTLLAKSKMIGSPRIAPVLELLSPEATWQLGIELREKGRSATALCQLGASELRRGRAAAAQEHFEEARALDSEHFGAELGYGAALSCEDGGWIDLVAQLPEPPAPPAVETLVPAWSALGPPERKVVIASLAPFSAAVQSLASAGLRVHILPLDVRITDRPELARLAGERAEDDHRGYDALGGVAAHAEGIACVKVEELLDVTQEGWTFAHEFAHLAERALTPAAQQHLEALFARACATSYAFHSYQLRNQCELFAVAYTDFLLVRYQLPSELRLDDEGALEAVLDFVEACAAESQNQTRAP